MFGRKEAESHRKVEEQATLLRQYSDALRSLIAHAGGVSYPGDGLIPPAVAEKTLRMAIDSLKGSSVSPENIESASESRPLSAAVTRVKLEGAADVVIRQGEEPSMVIRCADKHFLPKVRTSVTGNCLMVDTEPVMVRSFTKGRGLITQVFKGGIGQVVNGDIINRGTTQFCVGNGNVQISSHAVHTSELGVEVVVVLPEVADVEIVGAGRVTYENFRQAELKVDISGSGEAEISGQVEHLDAEVSGAGNVSAYGLIAKAARLSVSGAGSVRATVTDSVFARVSGAGKIKVAGNPRQRDVDTSGVGKIKFVDRSQELQ